MIFKCHKRNRQTLFAECETGVNYLAEIVFNINKCPIGFMSFIFNTLSFALAGFIAEFFMISGWVFVWDMVETISITRSELITKRINSTNIIADDET